MKPHGFIYITTNTINNKKYIGQCSLHRQNNKTYLGSGKAIKSAIAKYGNENFSREILCYCFSKQDMNIIEELIIREHNAHISPNYYNIIPNASATGGFSGKTHSIETKEKIRQYGKTRPVTQKMKDNMSKIGKMIKTESQLVHSRNHMAKVGKLNAMPKEIRLYICKICNIEVSRTEYSHHTINDNFCCSNKCRSVNSRLKHAKRVLIEGTIYDCLKDAVEQTKITTYTIKKRIHEGVYSFVE